jgi:hypothetical protein
MSYEDTTPAVDKVLHSDGSVTTTAGKEILPADPNRAEEYQRRAAFADKWLNPDGSITDGTGRVILGADESRARDYESRMASTGSMFMPGGDTIKDKYSVAMFDSTLTYMVPRADAADELELPDILAFSEGDVVTCLIRTAGAALEETFNWNVFSLTDTATAVLQ